MQVPAWMRNRHLSRLYRVLEVVMTAVRADETPAIGLKLPDDITRIPAHRSPLAKTITPAACRCRSAAPGR
jgi:hypothetical protein